MTIELVTKTLHNKRSSKAELRQALAYVLGVELPSEPQKVESLHILLKKEFCSIFKQKTGLDYMFSGKDAGALKQIIGKIEGIVTIPTPELITNTFKVMIERLPEWYIQNAFSLPVINKKFNEIAASIKKSANGTDSKQGVSQSYKDKIRRGF